MLSKNDKSLLLLKSGCKNGSSSREDSLLLCTVPTAPCVLYIHKKFQETEV